MRILHCGRPLSPELKISEIENLNTGDDLHIVKTEPRRQEPRSPTSLVRQNHRNGVQLPIPADEFRARVQNLVNETRRNRPTPYTPHRNTSNARYNNCAILHRNFEACVQASMRGQDRVYNTDTMTPIPCDV